MNGEERSISACEAASTRLYVALAGALNAYLSGEQSGSIMFPDTIGVMLLTREHCHQATQRSIGIARGESQAMIALVAEGKEAVNATLDKAVAAGGRADPNPPRDLEFMFNPRVEDPDGYVREMTQRHARWRSQDRRVPACRTE
ncbi:MAG: VOC family protein [Acetobacteraceae bacterium]